MKRLNSAPAAILAVLLLAGSLVAVYVTRDSANNRGGQAKASSGGQTVSVDAGLLETATRMAVLAETGDEQNAAQEAVHLADHELDQAFATALRQAAAYRPPATGPLRDLTERIDQLKSQIAADQDRIAQLTKTGAANATDELELAQARLALEQDEVEDAQQDLARQGGDPHSALERALQQHEATQHQTTETLKSAGVSPTGTMVEQLRAWFALGSLNRQVLAAEQQAADHAAALAGQHHELEASYSAGQSTAGTQGASGTQAAGNTTDRIARFHRLSDQKKTLAELDQRIEDCQQLAGVYRAWSVLVETRRRSVLHLLLSSLAEIFAIVLASILASVGIRRVFRQGDSKRVHQVHVIAAVALQFLAVVLILLLIFGAPTQLSTIIGLATAGLTVVLRNFIVAFFGWFALMGKNGIRVGDWVEINGVSGEVIEISLLKTVLLELGNWNDTGHPTGRQVAFSNSYAMDGHYFNFSTSGQWLWDELEVTLPAANDPYLIAEEIRKLVERETEADARQAAQDWERVMSAYGARNFSAKPAVNLRPSASGLEVAVRYIVHAPQRYEMKSKLFQMIVPLLHKGAVNEAATV